MARRLAWLCGGLVVVGLLVRLGMSSETKAPPMADPARNASPPAPAPALGLPASDDSRAADTRKRLLKDDRLTPPGPEAGEAEWRVYEDTLRMIQENRDPLVAATPGPSRTEDFRKRIEARNEAARQRGREAKERAQKHREEARRRREEAIRKNEEMFGPRDRTRQPDPAFKAPPLGPPIVDDPPQSPERK